jgi:flagellar biosynthesis/type III secretory pathway chaperone
MDGKTDTELLAELIAEKHRVLEQLRELARMQPEIIGAGDMSRLMSVLAAKERMLSRLKVVEQRLNPFREQDPESRRWRSPAARSACRDVAERCEALLKEIMVIEKQSETELVARRDQTAARLHAAHDASSARSAYLHSAPRRASRLDVTSEGS